MEEKKKLKVMTRRAQNNKHKTIKEKTVRSCASLRDLGKGKNKIHLFF